jgi:hypothetical protein
MKTWIYVLSAITAWVSLASSALAGDLRRTVNYEGLGRIVGDDGAWDWIVCGNDQLHIESKHFAERFFIGPESTGVMIKGLSDHRLYQWMISLPAAELNDKIKTALNSAMVVTVRKDDTKVKKAAFSSGTVAIPHSNFDCKTSAPVTMNCNNAAGEPRPGCCEEGVNKQFRFTADFKDESGEIWRFRYYPGDGNSSITSRAGKGLVRHCVTRGLIKLKQ